ncbi:hypothetical protein QQS21_005151 [Conoideocrella luteorostrata]|uniref:Heterokaryon incompatibility domain-containing protein n=1 Tax=Conoideocrella luteorostrata TaxID=1105319 RepID=A0AAJ0FZA4_9HYPO|nr:hypothetical protein QQS21_005151 [Conoideocrella luteorostrata]
MTLCQYCTSLPGKLFSTRRQDQSDHGHQPNLAALQASAKYCPGCRLILHAIEASTSEHARNYALKPSWKPEERIHLSSTKFGWQVVRVGWTEAGHFRGGLVPSDDEWGDEKPPGVGEDRATFLSYEAQLIRHWLRICSQQHKCCVNQDTQFLPSRLIDVGTAAEPNLRLVQNPQMQMRPTDDSQYIVLSHCWGLAMPESGKTTSQTLERHLVSISAEDLPQTFQDFIDIARQLGVRHVWIDSLCIIQDSRQDWEKEAAQMAAVYSNARLTVAASGSADGKEGCHVLENTRSHGPVDLECKVVTSPEPNAEGPTLTRVFRLWSRDTYPLGQVLSSDPLTKRGWTLQERELSSRIVHYSRDSIRWECGAARASLEFPWGDHFSFDAGRLFDGGSSDRPALIGPPRSPSQPMDAITKQRISWFELVHRYSSRSLTNQGDILPAVSGIARSIAAQTSDEYFAGLWKSYFAHCLLWASDWHVGRGFTQHSRPPRYLAPSWSWASVKGPIHYLSWVNGYWHSFNQNTDPTYEPKVIDISLQASSDAYGILTGGHLKVEGKIAVAFSKQDVYAAPKDHLAVTFTPGPQDRQDLQGLNSAGRVDRIGGIRYDVPLCQDCSPVGTKRAVWLLCCLSNERSAEGKMTTSAIALENVTGQDVPGGVAQAGELGCFRRVGVAWGIDSSFWDKAGTARMVLI